MMKVVVVVVKEVDEFKRYSGKPKDIYIYSIQGLRETSVQENFWVSDFHDYLGDTIQK